MHEWLLVDELMEKVSSLAGEQGMSRVTRLHLDLGRESHITADSLLLCFQVKSKKTVAEGANLEIQPVPGSSLVLASMEGE